MYIHKMFPHNERAPRRKFTTVDKLDKNDNEKGMAEGSLFKRSYEVTKSAIMNIFKKNLLKSFVKTELSFAFSTINLFTLPENCMDM